MLANPTKCSKCKRYKFIKDLDENGECKNKEGCQNVKCYQKRKCRLCGNKKPIGEFEVIAVSAKGRNTRSNDCDDCVERENDSVSQHSLVVGEIDDNQKLLKMRFKNGD